MSQMVHQAGAYPGFCNDRSDYDYSWNASPQR